MQDSTHRHSDFRRQTSDIRPSGSTTVEALWMEKPAITLRGNRFVGGVAESILATAGLAECIADTTEKYIEHAVALAADVPHLTDLRERLRGQLLTSPLCNGALFAKNLETAYRRMWQAWCHTQVQCHEA